MEKLTFDLSKNMPIELMVSKQIPLIDIIVKAYLDSTKEKKINKIAEII